jgi:hypothetical protein
VIEPQARSREGWFRSRILTGFVWEPPLARAPRSDGFSSTRSVHSSTASMTAPFSNGACVHFKIVVPALFHSQGTHWIHACGSPCRKVAGNRGDDENECDNAENR